VEPEGGRDRLAQPAWETIEAVQRRREQRMQPCEWQFGLQTDACCDDGAEPTVTGATGELGEQRGLTDARITSNDERSTPLLDAQQTVEKVELTLAPIEALGDAPRNCCFFVEVRAASHLSLLDRCGHQHVQRSSRCRCRQPENFGSGKPESQRFGLTRSRL